LDLENGRDIVVRGLFIGDKYLRDNWLRVISAGDYSRRKEIKRDWIKEYMHLFILECMLGINLQT
jgi:hypothetical protein